MPISYLSDRVAGFVFVRFEGELTPADVRAHRDRMAADPLFRAEMPRLIDARQAVLAGGSDDAEALAAAIEQAECAGPPGTRRAVLVNGGAGPLIARVFEALGARTGEAYRVFRVYDDAIEWLTEPAPVPLPVPA